MPDFTPRPTVYKGIKMRSRLEAGYAQWLDTMGFEWEYEPCAFGSEQGQYLPDFRLPRVRVSWELFPVVAYIEVKPRPAPEMAERMAVIHDSEPDALLCIQHPEQPAHEIGTVVWVDRTLPIFHRSTWVHGPVRPGHEGDVTAARFDWTIARSIFPPHGPWYGEWWKGRNA